MSDEIMQDEDVSDNIDQDEKPAEIIPEKKKNEVVKPQSAIAMSESGHLMPKDSNEEYRVAHMLMSSGAVPAVFKSAPQVMMAMQFLKRFGMDPIVCIRQVCIVNGSLSIWGELPLGLVNNSGRLEWIKEIIYDSNYKEITFENMNLGSEPWGATCTMKMIGKDPIQRSFTRADAEKAGLWNKSIWKLYPKRMLSMSARAWALKDGASEIISGVSILEYEHGTIPDSNGVPMLNETNTMEKMKLMMSPTEVKND